MTYPIKVYVETEGPRADEQARPDPAGRWRVRVVLKNSTRATYHASQSRAEDAAYAVASILAAATGQNSRVYIRGEGSTAFLITDTPFKLDCNTLTIRNLMGEPA